MDFTFSPDTEMLRDMLRRFIHKEARPLEMKFFTSGELAPEEQARLRQAVQQLGLWGLMAPEEYGGGIDLITACVIEEELGATFIPVDIGDVSPLLYACQGNQVARYLEPALEASRRAIIAAREPEPYGLRPENWVTRAVPESEGFVLAGKKILTAQPKPEDFFIVIANAPEGLSCFLLDFGAPGTSIVHNGGVILSLDGCHLTSEAVLGKPGGALKLGGVNAARAWITSGARYVGIAERLLELGAEHARNWISLGAPLALRPAIQRMIAEQRVDIESSRWLVYHAAWLADRGDEKALRAAAVQVRLATGEMLKRAVDRTTMVFTGPGPSPQTEPFTLVKSQVPFDALEIALESARATIAADLLDLKDNSAQVP
jgi:alkylation response protein AidB-like acyl-CoA dehydrogenase